MLEWSVNGVQQRATGTLVTHASGNLSISMKSPRQTINVTGAGVTFTAPSNAQYGTTVHVTLTNGSSASFVPAFGTDWRLNGWTVPTLAAGQSITFTVTRPPMAAGTSGTPVVVLNPTPPI
jgi:predicted secreted protein